MTILNKTMLAGYSSNTMAAGANQHFFTADTVRTGRAYFRLKHGGSFQYRLFYSNTIDSTYANGSESRAGMLCGHWKILSLKCSICAANDVQTPNAMGEQQTHTLCVDGKAQWLVAPGECFATDAVLLNAGDGDYLCVEITFCGERIPYLKEAVIPVFVLQNGTWSADRQVPLPFMVGCDRPVTQRFGFLGDSITMGIGVPENSYLNWAALAAQQMPQSWACWNLGIGYGRASDAAMDGIWLQKAKTCDFVHVFYGVNDLMQGAGAQQLCESLHSIAVKLKEAGCKVGFFTVPPFDYTEEIKANWEKVNRFMLQQLCGNADYVFDVVPILGRQPPLQHCTRYGGHPNVQGCKALAQAYLQFLHEKNYL